MNEPRYKIQYDDDARLFVVYDTATGTLLGDIGAARHVLNKLTSTILRIQHAHAWIVANPNNPRRWQAEQDLAALIEEALL